MHCGGAVKKYEIKRLPGSLFSNKLFKSKEKI